EETATNPAREGTKACAWYVLDVPAGASIELRARLRKRGTAVHGVGSLGAGFERGSWERRAEADAFYDDVHLERLDANERAVSRQAYAGLVWSTQFYHYAVAEWLSGDPGQPPPPAARLRGRNHDFRHLYCRDVISMP